MTTNDDNDTAQAKLYQQNHKDDLPKLFFTVYKKKLLKEMAKRLFLHLVSLERNSVKNENSLK